MVSVGCLHFWSSWFLNIHIASNFPSLSFLLWFKFKLCSTNCPGTSLSPRKGRCEGLLCSLPEGASFLAWTSSVPLPSMNPQKGPEGTGRVRKQVGLTTRRWDDGVELSRFPFLVGRGRD